MKANPGGKIDPKDAIGREDVVNQIWKVLEVQSVYKNAERRIGKSTILDLLNSKPRGNWKPAPYDLEACHTAENFAEVVYRQVHQFLTGSGRAFRNAKELFAKFGGTEIGGVFTLPEGKSKEWKTILTESFNELHQAHQSNPARILFLWDEFPFMIDNIRKNQGERTAMEVLDTLRFIRETYPSIRMVLTGSIGLHHVLSALKKSGYANAPINNMMQIEIPPLSPPNGALLAARLLEGEKVSCDNRAAISEVLAGSVDNFPYYIHHLVLRLQFSGAKATVETIDQMIVHQLTEATDPWELKHYRNRITTYYSGNETAVLAILDVIAMAEAPVPLAEIAKQISAVVPNLNIEELRSVLTLLDRDHYVKRDSHGYSFKFSLIRRWWRLDRSL